MRHATRLTLLWLPIACGDTTGPPFRPQGTYALVQGALALQQIENAEWQQLPWSYSNRRLRRSP